MKNYNPTRPLLKICQHKFMVYMAVLAFLIQTAESGVLASLFAYIGDTFNLTEDGEATIIFGGVQLLIGTLVIPASLILLPCLKRINCSDTNNVIISIIFRIIALLLYASTSYDEIEILYRNTAILFVASVFYGCVHIKFIKHSQNQSKQ